MRLLEATRKSFDELIDFLEVHGNLVLGERWRVDKEGYHTYMQFPIDTQLIKAEFFVSESVIVNDEYRNISTLREWMDVRHHPRLKYNPTQEGFSDAYYY